MTRCPPACRRMRKPLAARVEDGEEEEEVKSERLTEKVEKGDRIFMADVEVYEEEKDRRETKEAVQRALVEITKVNGQKVHEEIGMVRMEDRWFMVGATGTILQRLHQELMEDKEPELEDILPNEYLQYRSVFTKASFDSLPP